MVYAKQLTNRMFWTKLMRQNLGLRNADLALSEKGFYGMSFALALFSSIAVQKNNKDIKVIDKQC